MSGYLHAPATLITGANE